MSRIDKSDTDQLKQYLERDHTAATTRIYLFEIGHYLKYLGLKRAKQATYQDVMNYLELLRDRYDNPGTITRILYAIRQYYFYLVKTGQRQDHPCRHLRIRDHKSPDIQVQDLLKCEELQRLLKREERYGLLELRNQVILTLLVYQALRTKEMAQMEVQDVNLNKATIYIKANRRSNARTLALQSNQVMIFYRYLNEVRPKLMKTPTQALILTSRGTAEKGEGIHYLIETFRPLLPNKRLTPTTIRQSVIANKLQAGEGLRQVQVFAGHKSISTTEKYRQTNLEQLQEQVGKYHPLN